VSGALAVASATAVLVDLLENRLIQREVANSIGSVTVTALPPDRISIGADERSGLNLFLYRVSADTHWRREESSSRDSAARAAPPLGLHLHYLLTAYGEREYEAEILLGYAMQALHETPRLDNAAISASLVPAADAGHHVTPTRAALAAYDSAGLQQLCIIPEFLSMEDMSRLWSSLQARYRPSMTYLVSSVAIGVPR
jgi:Pvc16 N-terminal domain